METPRQKLWISNTARSCCSRLDKYKWTRGSPAHSIVQVTQFFQVGLSQVADKEIILRCLHKVTIPASIPVVSCRSSLVIPNSKWIAFCVHCCKQNCKMFTSKTFMFINKAISGSTCCACSMRTVDILQISSWWRWYLLNSIHICNTKCFSTIKTQWNPGQLSLCRPGNTWSYSHKMAPPLPVSCLYWVALKLVSAPSTISTSIDQPSNQIVQFLVIWIPRYSAPWF